MKIDISKPLYCIDKQTDKQHKIDAIFFPLGKASGKDVIININDNYGEWRSIDDIEIINNTEEVNK